MVTDCILIWLFSTGSSISSVHVQPIHIDVITGSTSEFTSPGFDTGRYQENTQTFWEISSSPNTVSEHLFLN